MVQGVIFLVAIIGTASVLRYRVGQTEGKLDKLEGKVEAEHKEFKAEIRAYIDAHKKEHEALDGVAKALNRYETFTDFRDFRLFQPEHAIAFKRHLIESGANGSAPRRTIGMKPIGHGWTCAKVQATLLQLVKWWAL